MICVWFELCFSLKRFDSTGGLTLKTITGTYTFIQILVIERKGSRTLETETTTSTGAEFIRDLETATADIQGDLADFLVVCIGSHSNPKGFFVDIQATLGDQAAMFVLALTNQRDVV